MILVAGLAVAGLAGIAAAFYFSIRTGNSGYKRSSRVRSARSGRTGPDSRTGPGRRTSTDTRPARRSDGAAVAGRPLNGHRDADNSRTANAGRSANPPAGNYWGEDRTGPNPVMDFGDAGDPGLADGVVPAPAGRRSRAQGRQEQQVPTVAAPVLAAAGMDDDTSGHLGPTDPRLGEFTTGSRSAARLSHDADAADGSKSARSRRRVGFRKGADIDEEMWPADSFGGVTDDQFWDDLASDKPLTTTARNAQHGSGSRKRPPAAVPPLNARSGQKPGHGGAQGARAQDEGRAQGDGRTQIPQMDDGDRGDGRRAWNSGAYPETRPGPADRTVIQPVQAVPYQPAPVQTAPHQTAPHQTAPHQTAPHQTAPHQTAPYQTTPAQAARLSPAASQQTRGGTQPNETPGRRHASAGSGTGPRAKEDPLTSAAFSLRSSGPVDGHSQQIPPRSRDSGRERYDVAMSQDTQTFSTADPKAASGGYPGGVPPLRQLELPAGGSGGRSIEPRSGGSRSDGSRSGGGWSGPSGTAAVEVYGSGTGPASPYDRTSAYPYPGQPYRDPAQETSAPQSPATPPYGDSYGYGSPADDPRRPNGSPGHARPGANGGGNGGGDGTRGARSAYQPGNGYQPGHGNQPGGYQDRGYQDRGRGGPYDPRDDYRRLAINR